MPRLFAEEDLLEVSAFEAEKVPYEIADGLILKTRLGFSCSSFKRPTKMPL